ncbi:NAD(P)H-binding protein [Rubrobacter tropicus]|uniref:NAD(P)H-binding protein n=1 Tax=Rubrobacter tropicus TaxID=2653851 RepID=A0A6G8QCI5_9ACTN|nr:NAD(P)H-binding protein [Rubrobacter tropicus]QIN84196.1 NAD(P)H-binding protein [Rubrobacter tropicus]
MKVLLTGATGLLGGALLDLLISEGHEPRCLVREGSQNAHRLDAHPIEISRGDAGNAGDLGRALAGADALLHVAGIEYAPSVVEAARKAGVSRVVVVGSTSAHSAYEFRSGPKKRMEGVVEASGLDWTIARPAMIYGSERDKNVHRLLRFLDRSPVFPIFGPGTNLWQPVYHEDCARGVYEALVRPTAVGHSYDLPGDEPLAYKDLVKTAAQALGKRTRLVRLPLEPIRRALLLAETLRLPLPIKSEQVLRLREDKAYTYDEAQKDLGYAPRPFREGIELEVARLREVGLIKPKTA